MPEQLKLNAHHCLCYYTNVVSIFATSGRIQTFVLEKSRVVYHGIGEKNFHIFHSLIAGMDEQKLLYYYIENPTKYRYTILKLGERS